MKLIEAEKHFVIDKSQDTKAILKEPTFDFGLARESRGYAYNLIGPDNLHYNHTALRVGIALGRYNFLVAAKENKENNELESRLEHRFARLIYSENAARRVSHLLPTIGWEVEIPRIPYTAKGGYSPLYKGFSEVIGMDVNKASGDKMWEFAPYPSYSHDVASYILNQLIKGGFIASLADSGAPDDIQHSLDNKLVSLHINLGLPKREKKHQNSEGFAEFNAALAIAHTSALRLQHKGTWTLHSFQEDVSDMPNGFGGGGRFEMKDLEVRDASVYRLMHDAQLVGAALIGCKELGDPRSVEIWLSTMTNVVSAIGWGRVEFPDISRKEGLSELAKDPQLVSRMRSILYKACIEEKRYLAMVGTL